jgi:hypothetical protein
MEAGVSVEARACVDVPTLPSAFHPARRESPDIRHWSASRAVALEDTKSGPGQRLTSTFWDRVQRAFGGDAIDGLAGWHGLLNRRCRFWGYLLSTLVQNKLLRLEVCQA